MRLANALVAATFGSALLVAGPASADADLPSRIVSYADLDLSRAADVSTLYNRLELAAEKICRLYGLRESPVERRIAERCMAGALSKAVDQIGSVDLTRRFLVEYRYYVHERKLQVAQEPGGKNPSVAVGMAQPAASLGQNP